MQIIAGTGGNNTAEAVRFTRMAREWGVDGALVVTPYYNKATQRGLIAHYTAIADADRSAHNSVQRALAHRAEHAA